MKTKKFKLSAAILAAVAVLVLSAGGTFAYLNASTNSATNVFNHGVINISVDEVGPDGQNFTGDIAEDGSCVKWVRVKNDSCAGELNVAPCYVRVALVATWVNDDGTVAAVDAGRLVTYHMASPSEGAEGTWTKGSDGYYYYSGLLEADEYTDYLIDSVTVDTANAPSAGHLEINVLSDGVQQQKVASAWTSAPDIYGASDDASASED